MSDIQRRRGSGRPSNEDLKTKGLLRTSPKCKICQSPYKDEITRLILEGEISGEEIRRRFNELEYFKNNPLNPTNINSHKKHCDPETLAKVDHQNKLRKRAKFDPVVKKLYQQKYDNTFNKLEAVEAMYKQRLLNLGEVQLELESLKAVPGEQRSNTDNARIRALTLELDDVLHNITADMLKHVKVEEGSSKHINVIFINNVKSGVEKFIKAFVDVLVNEIDDSIVRERIKNKFIEKLDQNVAPVLEEKAIEAEFEIVRSEKLPAITK